MKLKILDRNSKKEKEVFLDLRQRQDGIAVVACDEEGNIIIGGHLVLIRHNGTITRYKSVSESLDFKTTTEGRIKLEEQ